jgi:hypothetical protein
VSSSSASSGDSSSQTGGFAASTPRSRSRAQGDARSAPQSRRRAARVQPRRGAATTSWSRRCAASSRSPSQAAPLRRRGRPRLARAVPAARALGVGGRAPRPARLDAMFLTGGAGGQRRLQAGTAALARVPGGIESAVKRVQVSVGGYSQHEREATPSSRVGRLGRLAEGAAAGRRSYTAQLPVHAQRRRETHGPPCKRLADEVGWRCFIVGNSVYFMSEATCTRGARATRSARRPGCARRLIRRRLGQAGVELELEVVLDRWGAPPGSVINVDGYGPPDGRWLVVERAARLLRADGDRHVSPTRQGEARTGERARVTRAPSRRQRRQRLELDERRRRQQVEPLYAEAKRISDAGGTYVYGGGHGGSLSTLSSGQGLDCSSSCVAGAQARRSVRRHVAVVSGEFARSWGEAGAAALHRVGERWARVDSVPRHRQRVAVRHVARRRRRDLPRRLERAHVRPEGSGRVAELAARATRRDAMTYDQESKGA